jgi:hypothetical protein
MWQCPQLENQSASTAMALGGHWIRIEGLSCVYCGELADTTEHWPPRSCEPTKGFLLPACRECNTLAGDACPFDFYPRVTYVRRAIRRKYRKQLRIPDWEAIDLNKLSYRLRRNIKACLKLKSTVVNRLAWNVEAYLCAIDHGSDFVAAPVNKDGMPRIEPGCLELPKPAPKPLPLPQTPKKIDTVNLTLYTTVCIKEKPQTQVPAQKSLMDQPTIIHTSSSAERAAAKLKWWRQHTMGMTVVELSKAIPYGVEAIYRFERGYNSLGEPFGINTWRRYLAACQDIAKAKGKPAP